MLNTYYEIVYSDDIDNTISCTRIEDCIIAEREYTNTERALYYADLVGTDMIYIELWDVDEDNRHLIASQSMQVKYAKQFQAWKEFKNWEAYTVKHEKEVAKYYKKRKEMPW